VSVVRSETFADSNRPPAVELKQHQRVCRELDEWKQRALNAQRQLSQFTTFAGCEKLKESERIRSWAVVTVAAASKPDADGWRFINLFDVVTVAGIAVTPKDESDDALRQARSNAKSTASRAITFVEGCGVLERGDQIYFHDDEDDSNKITGSRARVRFTVPVDQALNAIAFQTEPRPAPKSRGIHVAPLKCPNCGSTDRGVQNSVAHRIHDRQAKQHRLNFGVSDFGDRRQLTCECLLLVASEILHQSQTVGGQCG
jgi:hypothetical protein